MDGAALPEVYSRFGNRSIGSMLYEDGKLVGANANVKDVKFEADDWTYLFSKNGEEGYFAGDVGELLVYQRALNSSERQVGTSRAVRKQ